MSTIKSNHLNKTWLAVTAASALALTGCATDSGKSSAEKQQSDSGGALKIGLLTSMSGPAGLFGPATRNVAELAAQEINASGGVLGRKVSVVIGDDATNPDTGRQTATRLLNSDGVSVLVGMHTSATREAVLPKARSAGTLYMYTPVFEGGTCDPDLFTNGEVPSQQLKQTIPWTQSTTGRKKWFLLGNDYAWGRASLAAAKQYITASGGEVVGTAFVPLGTTDFQAVIQKIQQANPELLLPALVGGDAIAFEKQAYDAGLGNSQAQRLGILYEENTLAGMGPKVTEGMYTSLGYFQSLNTPANSAFLTAYRKKFGAEAPTVTSLSEQTYVAIKAWAQAANAAGSTEAKDVAAKLGGLSLDAPAGKVTFEKNRTATQPVYVGQVTGGVVKIEKTFPDVAADSKCTG
ncbi:substrate-binding protein [Streptomyces sp. HUAS ZL42]|uniref:substrate-binding protein n=1 Tax=Streptomyces sp. HUAS ZL42 TaxID=3231715 RepID=UPI00345E3D42